MSYLTGDPNFDIQDARYIRTLKYINKFTAKSGKVNVLLFTAWGSGWLINIGTISAKLGGLSIILLRISKSGIVLTYTILETGKT